MNIMRSLSLCVSFLMLVSVDSYAMQSGRIAGLGLLKRFGLPPLNAFSSKQLSLNSQTSSLMQPMLQKRAVSNYLKHEKKSWSNIILSAAASAVVFSAVFLTLNHCSAVSYAKTLDWSSPNAITAGIVQLKKKYPLLLVSQVVTIMQQLHVEPNCRDYNHGGMTPLHYMVERFDDRAIFGAKVLCLLGADASVLNDQKLSPKDYLDIVYQEKFEAIQAAYLAESANRGFWSRYFKSSGQKKGLEAIERLKATYNQLRLILTARAKDSNS